MTTQVAQKLYRVLLNPGKSWDDCRQAATGLLKRGIPVCLLQPFGKKSAWPGARLALDSDKAMSFNLGEYNIISVSLLLIAKFYLAQQLGHNDHNEPQRTLRCVRRGSACSS